MNNIADNIAAIRHGTLITSVITSWEFQRRMQTIGYLERFVAGSLVTLRPIVKTLLVAYRKTCYAITKKQLLALTSGLVRKTILVTKWGNNFKSF